MASRFLYHAQAVGISGQITKPTNQLISSQATSVLPPAGGYSSGRQDAYQLLEILSHTGTASEVSGSDNPTTGDHETSVTATVQGLNIGNVLLLDGCTARLSSVHPADGSQARITPQGSFFQNLQIAGQAIQLESRVDVYHMLDSMDKLREHYKSDAAFRNSFIEDAFVGKEKALPDKHHRYFPWRKVTALDRLPEKQTGTTIVPLFIIKNKSAPGFTVNGNVITIENFGTIALGELVISGYERRLTMLHADLGSPTVGTLSVASAGGNGGTTDPP